MAFSTINKSSSFVNPVKYTGTGSELAVTGFGFSPGLVWQKNLDADDGHRVFDVVRGATKFIMPNNSDVEVTEAESLKSFDADGCTIGTTADMNTNGEASVTWNWKTGTTSGLSGGDITPSSYSINTTSKFGIYAYAGTGTAGSIAHGLGAVPKLVIRRCLSSADSWNTWHVNIGDGSKSFGLNHTNAVDTNANYASAIPTDTYFYVGTDNQVNGSGKTYVAYVWAEVPGYCKIGSYTGNGNADGPFVFTGFKPSFVIHRKTEGSWTPITDDLRENPFNPVTTEYPSTHAGNPQTTGANYARQLLSNGFKISGSGDNFNESGKEYNFFAWGQPIVSNSGIPATAR